MPNKLLNITKRSTKATNISGSLGNGGLLPAMGRTAFKAQGGIPIREQVEPFANTLRGQLPTPEDLDERLVVEIVRYLVGGVFVSRFAGLPDVILSTWDFEADAPDGLFVFGSSVEVDPLP